MRRIRLGFFVLLAAGLLAGAISLVFQFLPAVVPQPAPAASPAPTSSTSASEQPTVAPPLLTRADDAQIWAAGKMLHITAYVPTWVPPNTTVDSIYVYHQVLTLRFNTLLILESTQAIPERYAPVSVTTVALPTGGQAQWIWEPYVAGPAHRLQFHQQGVFFRIQLLKMHHSLNTAIKVAAALKPLPAPARPSSASAAS
jgi:hypothetical protein